MNSASLEKWQNVRAAELDRIAAAHEAVGGTGRGRRWATLQVNHAYAMLLSSHFQGFCRDLHSECIDHVVRSVRPAILHTALRAEFIFARKLDRGNPNPGNIGADFTRLGLSFWDQVRREDSRNKDRQAKLDELSAWRNAIAHQDFGPDKLTPKSLTLSVIKGWRRACNALALSFDTVMARHIASIAGSSPW